MKKQKLCLLAPPPPPLPPTVPSLSVHQDEDVPENGSAVPSSSHDVTVLDHENAPLTLVPVSEQLPVTPVNARPLQTPVTCHTGTDVCKIVYFVLELFKFEKKNYLFH